MPTVINNEAEMEAALIAQNQATMQQLVILAKALIDNRLAVHEVDFDAFAQKVTAMNTLLDGDDAHEGFQAFAALSQKLNTVEATANNNSASITNLQTALNNQISTLTGRVDTVESEARTGREALDARITTLSDQYTTHVASQLAKDNAQDTRLDDHKARIEALEAAKILHNDRLTLLETDNTANKSAIAQLQTTVQAQANALQTEKDRAEAVEAEIRGELTTERNRIDGLVTASGNYVTHQQMVTAGENAAMAGITAAWAESGLTMPAGLTMPDGSVSQ